MSLLIFVLTLAVQGAPVADDPQLLAQAQDRCMTTYAVRQAGSGRADDAIYTEAEGGCASLNAQLFAALAVKLPPADAAAITKELRDTAKPRFVALLARIRADRAARAAQP
jgi:hypothetical protein